ncbi:hypothetical protein Tco_0109223 [Tanacetum coccineum]
MLGSCLQGEDFAKKMVELVNQRKKHFAEERARAKRNKPMTQSQLRTYMMNYLKNQGTWKLSQLKNLSLEEVKEEFDKLVKQDITRDDLTELYRIVMNRYGMDGPEDKLKKSTMSNKHLRNGLVQEQAALWCKDFQFLNTPGSDENSLKLYDLIADMKGC